MKYLKLKIASHLAQPIKVRFSELLKMVKPEQNMFGSEEFTVTSVMLTQDGCDTAPTKEGKTLHIEQGETFNFVMSPTLMTRCSDSSSENTDEEFTIELFKNDAGQTQWSVNVSNDRTEVQEKPLNNESENKVYESNDDKWDKINKIKDLKIARGQSFNIGAMTINGANPKLWATDSEQWIEEVKRCAGVVYDALTSEPKNATVAENDDDLPF